MKMAKLSRRVAALFCAALALWWLVRAQGGGIFATRARALGLGDGTERLAGTTNFWERLALGQSPYLRQGRVLASPDRALSAADPDGGEDQADPPPAQWEQEEDVPLSQSQPEGRDIVAQTFLPATDGSYPSAGGVYLYNRTDQAVDMEALAQAPITLTGQGKGPEILIVHTHATEAYTQTDQDVYTESDPYRTTDDGHNVLRVGDEMAAAFAQAGLNVLHDRTLHDYPNYNGAYTRSRQTVEEYLAAYPSISLVLDVHRDAMEGDHTIYKAVADPDALPDCAQVMLVVGTDQGGADHPNWRQNLSLAIALEAAMNERAPTLARPIALRTSAYNQQLSVGSLLVEVGTHGNTLQESIAAARTFAQVSAPVIAQLLGK